MMSTLIILSSYTQKKSMSFLFEQHRATLCNQRLSDRPQLDRIDLECDHRVSAPIIMTDTHSEINDVLVMNIIFTAS